jgi:hypothetical protein
MTIAADRWPPELKSFQLIFKTSRQKKFKISQTQHEKYKFKRMLRTLYHSFTGIATRKYADTRYACLHTGEEEQESAPP